MHGEEEKQLEYKCLLFFSSFAKLSCYSFFSFNKIYELALFVRSFVRVPILHAHAAAAVFHFKKYLDFWANNMFRARSLKSITGHDRSTSISTQYLENKLGSISMELREADSQFRLEKRCCRKYSDFTIVCWSEVLPEFFGRCLVTFSSPLLAWVLQARNIVSKRVLVFFK